MEACDQICDIHLTHINLIKDEGKDMIEMMKELENWQDIYSALYVYEQFCIYIGKSIF